VRPFTQAEKHVVEVVERLTPEWITRLALGHWEYENIFVPTLLIEEPIYDDFIITATTETRWNYLQARVKWYVPSAVRLSDQALEATLVHELCHVALAPEQDLIEIKYEKNAADLVGEDHDPLMRLMFERMEMATEVVARSILRAWGSMLP
jgi:hypothetical protein